MEDDLLWKMTFNEIQPSMDDTFSGRRLLFERFRNSALSYNAVVAIFYYFLLATYKMVLATCYLILSTYSLLLAN